MRWCEEAMLVEKIRQEQQRLGVARRDWVGGRGEEEQEEEEEESEQVNEEEKGGSSNSRVQFCIKNSFLLIICEYNFWVARFRDKVES